MAKYLIETDDGAKYEIETEEPVAPSPVPVPSGPPSLLSRLGEAGKKVAGVVAPALPIIGPAAQSIKTGRAFEATSDLVGQGLNKAIDKIPEPSSPSFAANLAGNTGIAGLRVGADLAAGAISPLGIALGPAGLSGKAVKGAGEAVEQAAVPAARRALGFMKSDLMSAKSAFESARKQATANKSAKALLDKGAISKSGSTSTTAENVTKLVWEGSKKLENVLSSADEAGAALPQNVLADKLIDGLKAQYPKEQSVLQEILDEVATHGEKLSLKNLDDLRARWGKIGYQDRTVSSDASNLFRAAHKLADRAITEAIEGVGGKELGAAYKSSKRAMAEALTALGPLQKQVAGEMGNSLFSLPSFILAAGTGNIPGAAAALGATELIRRRGAGVAANILSGLGKSAKNARPGLANTAGLLAVSKAKNGKGEKKQ